MSAGEREPLLKDVEKARMSAPPTADGHRLLQLSRYSNANVPWLMVATSTMKWMLYVLTVSGSYFFMNDTWKMFTPRCSEYDRQHLALRTMCHVTGFCYWTFPLLCAILVIVTFWRHLYKSRLYYECLLHRVMISYDNRATFHSPVTWTFVIYGFLAVCVAFFVEEHPWYIAPFIKTDVKRSMVIYLSPIVSFFMVFVSAWQIEESLLPLPKFYETDPALAQELLAHAVFAPEVHLRVAFEEVEEVLDGTERDEPLSSAEYFGLIAEALKVELSRHSRQESNSLPSCGDVSCESGSATTDGLLNSFLAKLDLVRMEEWGYDYSVSRPDVLTLAYRLRRPNWWVHRVLHSSHFTDDRATSFRRWAWVHVVWSTFAILCIAEVFTATGRDWFKTQRQLPA